MSELTPQQQFQERIADRLRDDIGDLLPDEVLSEMVQRALQEMFFAKRHVSDGYRTRENPSWFEETVERRLREQIHNHITAYFKDNREELNSAIKGAINNGLADLLSAAVLSGFTGAGSAIGNDVGYALANGFAQSLRNQGLIQ